jgi:hypothetical protein
MNWHLALAVAFIAQIPIAFRIGRSIRWGMK